MAVVAEQGLGGQRVGILKQYRTTQMAMVMLKCV